MLLSWSATLAQDLLPEDRGAAGLWQEIKRLKTTATVLHLVAHPDDEDAALLTYLSRGLGYRSLLLSLTRGEGGANLISPDFFDALGVLRTLEMAAANRRYGVEQCYTRAADYGFSKTLEEALRSWGGEDKVLADVVAVVRRERPDVIIARFRGTLRDGHGHHQLAGVLAERAFIAAADPGRFTEQIEAGLQPWQARKLYAPASRTDPPSPDIVTLPTGTYDAMIGLSYAQLGQRGYSLHRSQGMMGAPSFAGPEVSRYRVARTTIPPIAESADDPFGLNPRLAAFELPPGTGNLKSELEHLDDAIREAEAKFDSRQPEKTLPALTSALSRTRTAMASRNSLDAVVASTAPMTHLALLLQRKEKQLEHAIVLATGLELTALTDTGRRLPWNRDAGPEPVPPFADATPGDKFPLRVRLLNRGRCEVLPQTVELKLPLNWKATPEPVQSKPLGENEALVARFNLEVPSDARSTRPHWRRESIEESFYTVDRHEEATLPLPPATVLARVTFQVLGTTIVVEVPILNAIEDPVLGTRHLPLSVVPALSVQFLAENGMVRLGQRNYRVGVTLRSAARGPLQGELRLELPDGWHAETAGVHFHFESAGQEASYEYNLLLPGEMPPSAITLTAVAAANGREYREGWRTITARDLGRSHFFRPARHTVRIVDVKVATGLRVGYVMGTGDEVPQGLELLGVRPDLLSRSEIESGNLQEYSALWIGVRAYAVRPELKIHHQRLMSYMERGGVIVVQYQTPEYQGNFAPHAYDLSSNPEEVSEQDAPVVILEPDHLLFTSPNLITAKDFDGWVEQRGSKFWKSWDARYTALLETHDTGQEPQKGGWLYTRHGRGAFVYCAYAWYRQLPGGVSGAYRIVANLLSLPATLR